MAAKLLIVVLLSAIIPFIIYRFQVVTGKKSFFWSIFTGVMASVPLLLLYYFGWSPETVLLSGSTLFIIAMESSLEEITKYFSYLMSPLIRSNRFNFLWLSLGFSLLENYTYFVHIIEAEPNWVLFALLIGGRLLISVPAHLSYAFSYIMIKKLPFGLLLASAGHTMANLFISNGGAGLTMIIAFSIYFFYGRRILNK